MVLLSRVLNDAIPTFPYSVDARHEIVFTAGKLIDSEGQQYSSPEELSTTIVFRPRYPHTFHNWIGLKTALMDGWRNEYDSGLELIKGPEYQAWVARPWERFNSYLASLPSGAINITIKYPFPIYRTYAD